MITAESVSLKILLKAALLATFNDVMAEMLMERAK
jgi:hypothetical protein